MTLQYCVRIVCECSGDSSALLMVCSFACEYEGPGCSVGWCHVPACEGLHSPSCVGAMSQRMKDAAVLSFLRGFTNHQRNVFSACQARCQCLTDFTITFLFDITNHLEETSCYEPYAGQASCGTDVLCIIFSNIIHHLKETSCCESNVGPTSCKSDFTNARFLCFLDSVSFFSIHPKP